MLLLIQNTTLNHGNWKQLLQKLVSVSWLDLMYVVISKISFGTDNIIFICVLCAYNLFYLPQLFLTALSLVCLFQVAPKSHWKDFFSFLSSFLISLPSVLPLPSVFMPSSFIIPSLTFQVICSRLIWPEHTKLINMSWSVLTYHLTICTYITTYTVNGWDSPGIIRNDGYYFREEMGKEARYKRNGKEVEKYGTRQAISVPCSVDWGLLLLILTYGCTHGQKSNWKCISACDYWAMTAQNDTLYLPGQHKDLQFIENWLSTTDSVLYTSYTESVLYWATEISVCVYICFCSGNGSVFCSIHTWLLASAANIKLAKVNYKKHICWICISCQPQSDLNDNTGLAHI